MVTYSTEKYRVQKWMTVPDVMGEMDGVRIIYCTVLVLYSRKKRVGKGREKEKCGGIVIY